MASVAFRHDYFGQSRLKYDYPLERYDKKSHLPNISKRSVGLKTGDKKTAGKTTK